LIRAREHPNGAPRSGNAGMKTKNIPIDGEDIRSFCEKHRIARLALFGSVLRDDFTGDSDVDVLVEFEPDARVGLIRFASIEHELAELLGRDVDLNTLTSLNRYFRDDVLREAEWIYDAS
jgi:predicted nucleotidyltransferase